MRPIDADNVLKGIEELKKSPWFNRGKEIVKSDPGFQHIGYLERKEAVEVVRDLCIRQEPTVGGWISCKDRLPEDEGDVLVYGVSPRGRKKTAIMNYLAFEADRPRWALDGIWTVLYWMPIPEPPKEDV